MGGKLTIVELQRKANVLRQDVIRMLGAAGSGHTAGSLDLADIVTALYFNIMKKLLLTGLLGLGLLLPANFSASTTDTSSAKEFSTKKPRKSKSRTSRKSRYSKSNRCNCFIYCECCCNSIRCQCNTT